MTVLHYWSAGSYCGLCETAEHPVLPPSPPKKGNVCFLTKPWKCPQSLTGSVNDAWSQAGCAAHLLLRHPWDPGWTSQKVDPPKLLVNVLLEVTQKRGHSALGWHFTVIARSCDRTDLALFPTVQFIFCMALGKSFPSPHLPLPTQPSSELRNVSRHDLLQCRGWLGLHN